VSRKSRNNKCKCGNVLFGFNCSCVWSRVKPGTITFVCEFCGIYEASQPQCNKCEAIVNDTGNVKEGLACACGLSVQSSCVANTF
jgi:hypothetical protein